MVIKNEKYARITLIIFSIAAILYNSWPLGYLLNPKTASNSLASDLNGVGQPYRWLFIYGDVTVGAALIAISMLMLIKYRRALAAKTWTVVFFGLVMFGLFTATSAASTNSCLTHHINVCATISNKKVGPDGMESVLAALGLLVSLVSVNLVSIRSKISGKVKLFSWLVLGAWTISGVIFLMAADKNSEVHAAQQALLIISGLALFIIGLDIFSALERQSAKTA